MTHSSTLFVGVDVHTETIAVASVAEERAAAVVFLGTIGTRPCDSDKLSREVQAKGKPLPCVSEAGPCGDWRSRSLTKKKRLCGVVAPACSPKKARARVQTERREAVQLARLLRSGDLTPIDIPRGEAEARRDVVRARAAARKDLKTATGRRQAFRLRQDIRAEGRGQWGPAHLRGLAEVGCPTPAQPSVFPEYVRAVSEHTERLQRLAADLQTLGQTWRWLPVVEASQALRGVQFLAAVTLSAELGELPRFANPRQLRSSLDLIPSEPTTGERRRQGAITTTGNAHARRVLIEGAWTYRSPAKGSRHLQLRLDKVPKVIQAMSGKAQGRLCTRYRRLLARGKHVTHVVVAIARAMYVCILDQAGTILVHKNLPTTPEAFLRVIAPYREDLVVAVECIFTW